MAKNHLLGNNKKVNLEEVYSLKCSLNTSTGFFFWSSLVALWNIIAIMEKKFFYLKNISRFLIFINLFLKFVNKNSVYGGVQYGVLIYIHVK